MTFDSIEFFVRDGYAQLTLNRPQAMNSFTAAMHAEVRDALTTVACDKAIRALLLTGAGRGFCAGQDLNDRKRQDNDGPIDLGESLDNFYNPLIRSLRHLPKPVVCAVNGAAAGAGANLALACDIVLAARSAKFIQGFCKIGLMPDSGGTWVLPRLVGHARATALTLLGEPVSAEKAADIGMIYQVFDNDQLLPAAQAMCAHLATQPTAALAATKRALLRSLDNSFDAQLDLERDAQRHLGTTADYREGVSAFLAKRKPNFAGDDT
ncbi:MAG: 2-(1,2-epoxy-1,2-dihydrophenyl)acetyl-CoA isomerase PaaG [Gammaproteobacteria bacterium]